MALDLKILTLIAVGIGGVFVTIYRQRRMPAPETLDSLKRRVSDLEQTVAQQSEMVKRQDATIKTLQSLLYEKQAEINQLMTRIWQLEHPEHGTAASVAQKTEKRVPILACIGDDGMFEVDLTALRAVRTQTGLRFSRLYPVTLDSLERKLNSDRASGKAVRYIHFAVHSGPEGLVFGDGIATGLWLSQRLSGVEVAVIAGCKSDVVGDLLGVVRAVVTMREDIRNSDAALFTEVFWTGIGNGMTVDQAFEEALDRCPPEVAEFVELH